jgi:predicted metal-binding membrane protein
MVSTRPLPTRPSTEVPNPRSLATVCAGIVIALTVSWAYVVYMVRGMTHMDVSAHWLLMPRMDNWNGVDVLLVFVMWAIMMAAMMLPSAVPMLLLLAQTNYVRYGPRRANLATGVSGLGYITAWVGFSLLATLAQWGLLTARLVSPMMESLSPIFSSVLLIAAGAYQFTPFKDACLSRCRSSLSLLMTAWGNGLQGPFFMGIRQGAYCTGCCWLLMAALFAFGVMNLIWIAALSLVVLLEKLVQRPRWFSHLLGGLLLVWELWLAGRVAL